MNTKLQIGTTLLSALLACGLVACTSSGSSLEGTGGSTGTGGTGGTTSPPVGSGGSTMPTTSTEPQTDGQGTLCPPAQQLITDFPVLASADGGASTDPRFGSSGYLTGGLSPYPTSMTTDQSQGNWHISGTVKEYSGFNTYFDNCDRVDASKFSGVSFTVSGTVPSAMTFQVGTVDNTPTWTWMLDNGKTTAKQTDVGKCTPKQDTKNQYYAPGCSANTMTFTVSATPTTITVPWTALAGGSPVTKVSPAEITAMQWTFPWVDKQAPYQVDFTIDNITFLP